MIRRLLRWTVGLAVLLVASSIVLAGLLAWRLSRGPVPLDFLTPRIEAELSPADGSFRVRIGATELIWAGWERNVDLRARDVSALSAAGETIASLPALAIELSWKGLLAWRVQPVSIEAIGPTLRLVRQADGTIDLGLGGEGAPATGDLVSSDLLARLSESGAPDRDSAVGRLRSVEISDARVSIEDREAGAVWNAPALDLRLVRTKTEYVATLSGQLEFGGAPVPLSGTARAPIDGSGLVADLSVTGLRPTAIAAHLAAAPWTPLGRRLVSQVPLLERFDLALDAKARVSFDAKWNLARFDGELHGGDGSVAIVGDQRTPVRALDLALVLEPPAGRFELVRFDADLAGPKVAAHGTLEGLSGPGGLSLAVDVTALPVAFAWKSWPAGVADGARSWLLANLSGGAVDAVHVDVKGRLEDGDPSTLSGVGVSGKVSYSGLAVRFVDTLPSVTGVQGSGTFTQNAWNLRVDRGKLDTLAVGPGTVAIAGIGGRRPTIAIAATVKGPLRDTLGILDRPPIELSKFTGLPTAEITGTVSTRVSLGFPLDVTRVDLASLGAKASADLSGVGIPALVGDWSIRDGAGHLEFDPQGVRVDGNVSLEGVPLAVTWREDLRPKANPSRLVTARGTVDQAGRARLGFDLAPALTGPVGVDLRLTQTPGRPSQAVLACDLGPATVDVPEIAWKKSPDEPARASATLIIADGALSEVRGFSLDGGSVTAIGHAVRGGAKRWWKTIAIDGSMAGRGPGDAPGNMSIRLSGIDAGYDFQVTSNDSGALFRALGFYADAEGGDLAFSGRIDPGSPGMPFSGHGAIRKFTVTEAPALARLATLASLQGVSEALTGGRGIAFDALKVDLSREHQIVTIASLKLAGPSLGLSLSGTVDQGKGATNVRGTLIPALYGINRAIERIPVVGWVVGGDRKGGAIGMDFSVEGPIADPKISVHPIDSITPNIVKSLLGLVGR